MEKHRPEQGAQVLSTVELLSDQERYDRAFAIADRLILEGGFDPIENPALLAEAVVAADIHIGYNHALTVVLSL